MPNAPPSGAGGRPERSHAAPSAGNGTCVPRQTCPRCRAPLSVAPDLVGRWIECPRFGEGFTEAAADHARLARRHPPSGAPEPDDPDGDSRTGRCGAGETSSRERYCVECGAIIRAGASICPECDVSQTDVEGRKKKHCHECGALIRGKAVVCPECGVEQDPSAGAYSGVGTSRITAGILAILLGQFAIHKFMLGYASAGIVVLMISLISLPLICCHGLGFIPLIITFVIWVVEGVLYLCMSDQQFQKVHGNPQRPWF
jgi:RNA polymerase subunit RPABC4/transcription elongation factor Spt4/TM2 domain-containing membrane protein YozV